MADTEVRSDAAPGQSEAPQRRVSRYQALRDDLSAYSPPERKLVFGEYVLIWMQRFTFCVRYRFVYPFLPIIAMSLGVSLGETANAVAIAEGVTMICPLVAPFGDVFGKVSIPSQFPKISTAETRTQADAGHCKRDLSFGVHFTSRLSELLEYGDIGRGLLKGSRATHVRRLTAFLVSCILCNTSFYINNASTQALLNQLSKKKKTVSKMTGIKETAHAMSAIIGFPVLGLVLTHYSLQVAFMIMCGLCIITFPLTFLFLPPSPLVCRGAERYDPPRPKYTSNQVLPSLAVRLRRVLSTPLGIGPLLFILGIGLAAMYSGSALGILLTEEFGMSSDEIGYISLSIGVAELTADVLSLLVARCAPGTATMVVLSLCFAASCIGGAFLVPLGVILVVATVWLHNFFFEWIFVVGLTMFVKSLPEASNTFLSLSYLAMSVARMIVFLSIDPVWAWAGWWSTSLLLSIFAMFALIPMALTMAYRDRRIKSGKHALAMPREPAKKTVASEVPSEIPSSDSTTSEDTASPLPSFASYDTSIPTHVSLEPEPPRITPFDDQPPSNQAS